MEADHLNLKTRKETKVGIKGVTLVGTRTLTKGVTKVGTHKTISLRVAEAMVMVVVEEAMKTVMNVNVQDTLPEIAP